MTMKVEKERVCFWLPIVVHNHLRDKAIQGKKLHGNQFGMGDIVTEFCVADNPELIPKLVESEKVSKGV
jgi:hypothetical protein